MRFRVNIEYEYEVTHEGMANYDDQDPAAMAAADLVAMTDDPMIVMEDLASIPSTIKVTPV